MRHPTLLLALGLTAPLAAQTGGPYLDFAGVERRLEELARQNPERMKLEVIGASAAGKKLYAAQVAAAGPVEPAKRPAVFVGANTVGWHNAGTQAALHLLERLLAAKDDKLLAGRTFYIAPALNPDAHDAMFQAPRWRCSLNGARLDRDRDGLEGEDGPNDLNNDGRITQVRVPDPAGDMLPDPDNPRLMVRADPLKGQKGAWRVYTEGFDDDGDGQYNEDPPGGYRPDKNFAHGFADNDPESGPWPSFTPEAKAIMDYLLGRRNLALAVVYGPANSLLELPRGAGTGPTDIGQMRVTVPRQWAQMAGLDPQQEYTIDELWEMFKDQPMARQMNMTKEMMAQFLGGGLATRPDDEDLKYFQKLSDDYKKTLEKAGLDTRRAGRQSQAGGLTNWLYYQYGVMAVELDVWGVPRRRTEAAKPEQALTLERLEKMSSEEFLALGEDRIVAFLKEIKAPPMVQPAMLIEGVKSGKMTPARMAAMVRQMGGGAAPSRAPSGPAAPASGAEQADLLAYIDKEAPGAFVAWTPVTLPDGTRAEVGGVDPFLEVAPPEKALTAALAAHTDTVLDLAGRLARLEITSTESTPLGRNVWRVKAVAANSGSLPTLTRLGQRTRNYLPVRLQLELPPNAALVAGVPWVTSERLAGGAEALQGEWLVRADRGARLGVVVSSNNAGGDRKEIVLAGGN